MGGGVSSGSLACSWTDWRWKESQGCPMVTVAGQGQGWDGRGEESLIAVTGCFRELEKLMREPLGGRSVGLNHLQSVMDTAQ